MRRGLERLPAWMSLEATARTPPTSLATTASRPPAQSEVIVRSAANNAATEQKSCDKTDLRFVGQPFNTQNTPTAEIV